MKKLKKMSGKELLELHALFVKVYHYDPEGELEMDLPEYDMKDVEKELYLRLGEEFDEEEDYEEDETEDLLDSYSRGLEGGFDEGYDYDND